MATESRRWGRSHKSTNDDATRPVTVSKPADDMDDETEFFDCASSSKSDDISEGLWLFFKSMKKDIEITKNNVTELNVKLGTVIENNGELDAKVGTLENRLDIVEGGLRRSEQINKRLSDQMTDMQMRSMKNNIIFSFERGTDYAREVMGENCVELVKQFLHKILGLTNAPKFFITVAHRIGPKNDTSRSIIAKFPISSEIDIILRNASRLRDTKHHINKQIPANIRERNQFALPEYQEKRANPSNKARLSNGKLYVKGRVETKYLPAKLPVATVIPHK